MSTKKLIIFVIFNIVNVRYNNGETLLQIKNETSVRQNEPNEYFNKTEKSVCPNGEESCYEFIQINQVPLNANKMANSTAIDDFIETFLTENSTSNNATEGPTQNINITEVVTMNVEDFNNITITDLPNVTTSTSVTEYMNTTINNSSLPDNSTAIPYITTIASDANNIRNNYHCTTSVVYLIVYIFSTFFY